MVLAVAAGIVIYAYVMGYLGGFGGTNSLGALSLDSASISVSGTPGAASIDHAYIRNIGKTSVSVKYIYLTVGGKTSQNTLSSGVTITQNTVVDLASGSPILLTTPSGATINKGDTVTLKLVCEDNTQLSFDVKTT